jgi:hypothetical protein
MPLKILLVVALVGGPLVPTFWSILDIPKRRFSSSRKKMIWFALVSTLPFLGGMLYILFARRHTQPLELY